VAVGRFFRAWFYYEKVKRFGDVPWMGAPIEVNDTAALYRPRDPRTLVMDSVLADCRSFPGPIWDLGANFIKHSLQRSTVELASAGS